MKMMETMEIMEIERLPWSNGSNGSNGPPWIFRNFWAAALAAEAISLGLSHLGGVHLTGLRMIHAAHLTPGPVQKFPGAEKTGGKLREKTSKENIERRWKRMEMEFSWSVKRDWTFGTFRNKIMP